MSASFIESLETRVLYRRPFVSSYTREWVVEAADWVRQEQADVKSLAGEHRAAIAAAAGAGKTLIAADRQALREALVAGDTVAIDAARAKLDADRVAIRAELATLREAARADIAEEREGLSAARKDLAHARKAYGYEAANPDVARRRDGDTPPAQGGTGRSTSGGLVIRNGTTGYTTGGLTLGLENGGDFDWLGSGISTHTGDPTAGSVLYGIGVINSPIVGTGLVTTNAATST